MEQLFNSTFFFRPLILIDESDFTLDEEMILLHLRRRKCINSFRQTFAKIVFCGLKNPYIDHCHFQQDGAMRRTSCQKHGAIAV